jgi:hypothetical protein
LREAESDPLGDKVNHHQIGCPPTIDPIYQLPSESDSDYDREVYMMEQSEQPAKKATEEIARGAEEEIT